MVGACRRADARFAGIRTFTMLGATAGLCGWLWKSGLTVPSAILLTGAVAITAVAYLAASRRDVDATTEVAALIVLAAGLLAEPGRSASQARSSRWRPCCSLKNPACTRLWRESITWTCEPACASP